MIGVYITSFFLFVFGTFNLIGIRKDLLDNYLILTGMGITGFFVFKYIGTNFLRQNAKFFYWLFIVLLIVTYIVGIEVKGSQRWIDLYFFRFQPSEFFKVFFIVFLADLYSKPKRFRPEAHIFLSSLFYFALPTLIIFKQPDLGSAMVFVFIFVVMSLFSGLTRKYMVYLIIAGIIMLPLMWNFLHDYQRNRILSFINPHISQETTSYNMTQALITSGSGQLMGRGLGLGKQSRLYFLPEYHTDFAYSSLVEQFGFVGGAIVIILYMVLSFFLIRRLIEIYMRYDDKNRFQFLYTLGFFSFIVCQVFVNIGMNIGVLPIAGITLPLISYGGASLITYLIGLALL